MSQPTGAVPLGRSGAFLYIENIIVMLPGYLYWLMLSRLVSQETIGSFSAVASLSAITANIVMLGIPIGCQRFISKSLSEGNYEEVKVLVQSSIIILTLASMVWVFFMLYYSQPINAALNLSPVLGIFLLLHTCATAYYTLIRGFIISTLNTRIIATATILTTAIRFACAILLVLLSQPYLGIALGIILLPIVSSLFLTRDVIQLLRKNHTFTRFALGSVFRSGKQVIIASMAGWIPSLITLIGTNLGVVAVNALQSSYLAAIYFIAFAIVSAILGITSVFFSVGYPVLSAMKDGRKRAILKMTKLCLIIVMPLAFSILPFSRDVMGIFGDSYQQGWLQLDMLLLSLFPASISGFMTILSYSYGKYRHTLFIGIASTLPRLILYAILVPNLGAEAALSYLSGAWIGLIPSLMFSRQIGLRWGWKDYILISVTPLFVSLMFASLQVSFVVGIVGTLLVTYILLLLLKIIVRNDVAQLLTMLPRSLQRPAMVELGYRIAKKLNPSF